jgi:hypothetical protein
VTLRRVMTLWVGVGLSVLCLTAPAWAHPGHGPTPGALALDGFHAPDQSEPESEGAAKSWDTLRRHAPMSAALVVAALALLAHIPHRRRALALALVLLLSMVSLEGVLHAALHLHHARHADSLAIGASAAQLAAAGPDPDRPFATPVMLLGDVVERYVALVPDVVVASNRGRSPPLSPA